MDASPISLILPALNEEEGIGPTIDSAVDAMKKAGIEHEIVVVDDGSTDRTAAEAENRGARVLRHPVPMGYGASLLDGIRQARHDWIAISDADGTYPVERIPEFAETARRGFRMVVARRDPAQLPDSFTKSIARRIFRWLAQFTTGTAIPDVNSGFRLFHREVVLRFASSFGRSFSFSTTLTLLATLYGYPIAWTPIDFRPRKGKSKVRTFRDSLIAAQILLEVILTHNPLKIFLLGTLFSGFLMTLFVVLTFVFPFQPLWPMLATASFVTTVLTTVVGMATTALVKARRQTGGDSTG